MRKLLLAASVTLLAAPALAAPWVVDAKTSRLRFTGTQAEEVFEGGFQRFDSAIDFEETAPEKGQLRIVVAMDSLEVDGKDRADALPTSDWFASKQFPTATFTSNEIRRSGAHAYVANGTLTLRGISKPLALPFTLTTQGTETVASGSVTLNRSDFGIGQGRWTNETWVKNAVTVRYEIHAQRD